MRPRYLILFCLLVAPFLPATALAGTGAGEQGAKRICAAAAKVHESAARQQIKRIYGADGAWLRTKSISGEQRRELQRRIGCSRPSTRKALRKRWKDSHQRLERTYREAISPPGAAKLRSIRNCESGTSGGYRADTGNGFYGAYQFSHGTWKSVGGKGYPHRASPREQDWRAAKLYRRDGTSPWPHCA